MHAVIMAGGKGERLWPKSTRGRAKHVIAFGTRNVMIQETINRLKQNLPLENIYIVTTKAQYPTLRPYVSFLKKKNIILEPEGKDTAAAICLAASILKKRLGNVTMAVLPADHIIKNTRVFFKNLLSAEKIADSNTGLVTIGIKPKYASIGYGYIRIGRRLSNCYVVKRFEEKPKRIKAEKFYKRKNYLWNSGIFVWKVDSILAAIKRHTPHLYYCLKDVVGIEGKYGYSVKLSNEYSRLKRVSIDYGVMEPITKNRTQKIFCLKAEFDWVDIGSWSSLEEIYDKDTKGNIILSNSALLDVRNSTVIGERGYKIGIIGVKDLIIVHTNSGTLICDKNRAQEVKDLVKSFK
ncbi:MAG: NTP transferase domain-containing protein [Candidatus Omnitrophica bacterium]|nr:NTP transferase domain-containing protein [Candidatus Omnitrophota bacterium]